MFPQIGPQFCRQLDAKIKLLLANMFALFCSYRLNNHVLRDNRLFFYQNSAYPDVLTEVDNNADVEKTCMEDYVTQRQPRSQGLLLKSVERKGPGIRWHLLKFHWSITLIHIKPYIHIFVTSK